MFHIQIYCDDHGLNTEMVRILINSDPILWSRSMDNIPQAPIRLLRLLTYIHMALIDT